MAKKVLVADDSLTIRKVIGMIFATEDFSVTMVDNGLDAVNKARELRPDVVLADCMMPGKSGYEVAEAIKSDPSTQGIPVMLLAGTFEPFDENRARASRADSHIVKPFDSQGFLDKVKTLVGLPTGGGMTTPTYQPVSMGGPPPAAPTAPHGAVPGQPRPMPGPAGVPGPGGMAPPSAGLPGARAPAPGMPSIPRPPPSNGPPMGRPPGPGMPQGLPRPPGPMGPGPGQPMARPPGPGMPMPGQPMARPPMPGQMPGQPMQPMARPPMQGQPMPGQPMPPGGVRRDPFGLGGPGGPPPQGMPMARPPMGQPMPPQAQRPMAPAQHPAGDGGEAALREALSKASREVIEKIAWEVVPQLAETIIREELDRLIKDREQRN